MRAKTAFALGWFAARTAQQGVLKVVMSDTSVGRDCVRSLLRRMEQAKLLRLEEAVQEEIIRRTKTLRDERRKHEDIVGGSAGRT